MQRILVCGSRDWNNIELIHERLKDFPIDSVVIHGGCKGADIIAGVIAKELGMEVLCFTAEWKKYGKSAGPKRNQRMLDEGVPTLVLAFHDDINSSKGTLDMIKKAKGRGITVELIESKSETTKEEVP